MNPIVRIRLERGAKAPEYQSEGAAGADLFAYLSCPMRIPPGGRAAVPTGLYVAIPEGWEAQVRPRSGIALKRGITCLNSPGTIDSDYRGEVKVILANLGQEDFVIENGDRIAQMVIAQAPQAVFVEGEIGSTTRSEGGFGSTGMK